MSTRPNKRTGSRVLGARTFAAITAVEGLELSPSSRGRLRQMANDGLSLDERRETLLRAWRVKRPS